MFKYKNNPSLRNFRRAVFILIGETHGIKENIAILKLIVKLSLKESGNNIILSFEWPNKLTGEINSYLKNRASLNWRKWNFIKYGDGRISKEHIAFLKWIKEINFHLPESRSIKVRCFDVVAKRWNERDKKMANIFLRENKYRKIKAIAVMGNLHARKKVFFLNRKKYIPLGAHLLQHKVLSIRLEYMSGHFYNDKIIKEILPTRKINMTSKFAIRKTGKSGYDYTIFIKKAHPVRPL